MSLETVCIETTGQDQWHPQAMLNLFFQLDHGPPLLKPTDSVLCLIYNRAQKEECPGTPALP